MGVDVGKARIGLARCDPHAMLATPLETVPRARGGDTDITRILELAHDAEAIEIVVGLPLGLGGHRTPSTDDAENFANRLAAASGEGTVVRLVDERLSTVSAQSHLREAGKKTKQSRAIIDQAAAVVILQHALDVERARSEAPGTIVTPKVAMSRSQTDKPAGAEQQ